MRKTARPGDRREHRRQHEPGELWARAGTVRFLALNEAAPHVAHPCYTFPEDMTGQTIGHYEILEKLGEGGMGVVYKARDTRLNRPVALKLLPGDNAADGERLRRFTQEARTASALNHPNIITIHDIGSEGGVPFIVMEYVAGRTLDQLIPKKGMRLDETLRIGAAIADALAAAASAGVVHRDIKPGNVMVSESGHVKVLDFGLARPSDRATGAEQATATIAHTGEGAIVGTVFYMSPEQAEGKPVDPRSDIFSFGAVLYEMTSGQRPFRGETAMSAISSILRDDPPPLASGIPRDLEKIIARCLRKDPARRFQTMADVRVALLELQEEGRPSATSRWSRRQSLRVAAIAVSAAALSAAAYVGIFRRAADPPPQGVLQVTPFTSYAGFQGEPAFSPDGSQIAFTWTGEKGSTTHLYVKMIGTETPLLLTSSRESDYGPAWSPDGRSIAFVRSGAGPETIYQISPLGGRERRIVELRGAYSLCWTPDGKHLISSGYENERSGLYAISVETGDRRAMPLDETSVSWPVLSPDGRKLAFGRIQAERVNTFVADLDPDLKIRGTPRPVNSPSGNSVPLAWTNDSSELLLSNNQGRGTVGRVLRVAAAGSSPAQPMAGTGDAVTSLAVSRKGNRMAYASRSMDINIWAVEIHGPGKAGPPAAYANSTRLDWARPGAWSPDGTRLAFESDRSGDRTIWISKADGTQATPLIRSESVFLNGSPAWSPDGKSIAFDSTKDGNPEIYLIAADGGAVRRLTDHPAMDAVPSWSRDGKELFFMSSRTGRFEIFKMPASGGDAVRVTQNGGWGPIYSPDGKYLYYARNRGPSPILLRDGRRQALLRMPAEGGAEEQVLEDVMERSWAPTADGIWYLWADAEKDELRFFHFRASLSSTVLTLPKPLTTGMALSPDGKRLLFNVVDQQRSEIILVENFR